jgi:hypothetical protein
MKSLFNFKMTTPALVRIFPLVFLALSPIAQAVVPAPDGGYPGGNTAEGQTALLSLTTGGFNTAVGYLSLRSDTTGSFNTAIGAGTLLANTADLNTAAGAGALLSNTTASGNTALGAFALFSNTTGGTLGLLGGEVSVGPNVAVGQHALESNTLGSSSVAVGYQALASFVEGPIIPGPPATDLRALGINTAVGFQALANTTGVGNCAFGYQALYTTLGDPVNHEGLHNVAIGTLALANNQTGSFNIALGSGAGQNVITANNVICIGHFGQNENYTTWIENIYGRSTLSGTTAPVVVSDGGQLGTVVSSERFKKDVATMDNASEVILLLRPVMFHYKRDARGTPQFGLIAEEVAKVNPALVLPDKEGRPYTVRYDAVNAMLLNEFLKEHRRVEELESTVAKQEAAIAEQQKSFERKLTEQERRIQTLTSGLQKVSAQMETMKPATQIVVNEP